MRYAAGRMLVLLCLCLLPAAPVRAELPSIRFDRIQPLGTGAGTSIEVEVIGRDTEDVARLLFDQPGFTAELVKPGRFRISVSADVPEGTYDVWMFGRFGVSNSRLFAVSRGLADVAEIEPNNSPREAQPIPINSAVNATFDGNGQDLFRIVLKAGERVALDCQAARLETPLDASMLVSSASGQILANNGDYFGRDPFIDFIAPADGEYLVLVHDLSYRGGSPYRLLITNRPQIENVFPPAVQAGKPSELLALGTNLASVGGRPSAWKLADLPLDELRFAATSPVDLMPGAYRFLEHPAAHSVLPTAATCTLNGFQLRVPADPGVPAALHPQCVLVTPQAVTVEQEPNDNREQPQAVTLPVVLGGRFDRERDADWYEFEAPENGNYYFDVYSERIAGRADPYLVVFDAKNNMVSELDDFGHRIAAFDGHLRDPSGAVSLQGKQKYRLLVQDRYGRGGARYVYVLSVRAPQPDFHIAAIHSENPGPSGLNIRRGGSEVLDLVVHQQDGFNGPVTVTATDLPPGLHVNPTVINNNTRGTLVLWANRDAAPSLGAIRLLATARDGDRVLTREVRPYARVSGDQGSSRPMRSLQAAILEDAAYGLELVPDRLVVTAGEPASIKLRATRIWPDFKDKINIVPLNFPGNFQLNQSEIAPGVTEINLTIPVQAGTRPGEYTLTVQGQAQVPYNKDPQAAQKPNTLVSVAARPITIEVREPPKKP